MVNPLDLDLSSPHLSRSEEIERAIEALRDVQFGFGEGGSWVELHPVVAGCGFGLSSLIGGVAGTSRMMPMATVSNAIESTEGLVTFDLGGKYVWTGAADGLAQHGFFELLRRKPESNLHNICALGITGTVASTDPSIGARGGQKAYISLRTSSGIYRLGIAFDHGERDLGIGAEDDLQNSLRQYQSQLVDIIALSGVCQLLGLSPIPLRSADHIKHVITGHRIEVEGGFYIEPEHILPLPEVEPDAALVMLLPDGTTEELDCDFESARPDLTSLYRYCQPGRHVLLGTSANPLGPHHDEMAKVISTVHLGGDAHIKKETVFTLTQAHPLKGPVPWEEIRRRASQFLGRRPVLILRRPEHAYYVEMARQLHLDLIMGGDNAPLIFDPQYCVSLDGPLGAYCVLKSSLIKIYLFPRRDRFGRILGLKNLPIFAQDTDLFHEVSRFLDDGSSTAMRVASNGNEK